MVFTKNYMETEPTRAEIDASAGVTLLEFGAQGCGFCVAIQKTLENALQDAHLSHVKIEDGSGRPLGRSFRVKLWPTLVIMRDGVETARVVRPTDAELREFVATYGS